jgi:hypothetical protein
MTSPAGPSPVPAAGLAPSAAGAAPAPGGGGQPAPSAQAAVPSSPPNQPTPPTAGDSGAPAAPDQKPALADSAGGSDPAKAKTTVDSADPSASGVDGQAGRQRQKNIENARYKIVGDMVGGDKFIFAMGDAEPAPLQTLVAWMNDPVRYAFVPPDGWDGVRAAAADRRVVVLRAEPGHGKVAAGIRLLQAPSDRRIFNLDRNVDLRRLGHWLEADIKSDDPLPRCSGFLLCEPLGWSEVPAWVLQQLETTLDAIDGRLVLTISADAQLADQDLLKYVVTLPKPRPQPEVLVAHLAMHLGGATTTAERILADARMTEFAGAVFAADSTMKAAADLAVMISQELDGASVDLERLERRWNERATEDFEIWFGGLSDIRTRCLAIALAVLNGLPYENVAHAARRLAERLDKPRDNSGANGASQPAWHDPFTATRGEMLRLLRARIRRTTVRGPFGAAPAEVMEYVGEDYASAVLERVWREYQIHRDLLLWLRDLAENRSEEVRIWAATALGVFCKQAFDYVYATVLHSMSIDEKFWLRDVVANALSVPAADGRLRPLVESLVGRLFGTSGTPLGQATAARVWGIGLGTQDVTKALTMLERLTTINDRRVARGIGDSLADLLLADEDNNAVPVLHRVSSWLHDPKRVLTGVYVFLWLAGNLTSEFAAGVFAGQGVAAPPGAWPMLLLLADQRPELRMGLVNMWQRVLLSGVLTDWTSLVLGQWADLAERDEGVRLAFGRMLAATPAAIGRGDPTESLVRYHATQWRSAENLQPKVSTAYAVEAALRDRNGA